MWMLSGLADEIDPDLGVQARTLADLAIGHVEVRGVWGKNVLDLSDAEVARVKTGLDETGIGVSAVASPIGKMGIGEPFPPHLERFKRALEIAGRLGTPFVRIFSFYLPEGEDPARHRSAVIELVGTLVADAERAGVTLLHENERHIYGDTPTRCHDLLATINSPRLRMTWDPANFVILGVRPFSEGYDLLRPYIAYLHVKDATMATGKIVPAGKGDGQMRETFAALRADGFDGFCSLEPHLKEAGPLSGFSGPELFGVAATALKGLLAEQGIAWR